MGKRKEQWQARSLDAERTVDQMIDLQETDNLKSARIRRMLIIGGILLFFGLLTIPFLAISHSNHSHGLVIESGRADFVSVEFRGIYVDSLRIDVGARNVRFRTHNADTIRFSTGLGYRFRYVFDAQTGVLEIVNPMTTSSRTGTLTISVPSENFGRAYFYDFDIRVVGEGSNVDISHADFENLTVTNNTNNGNTAISNVDISGNLNIQSRRDVVLRSVNYNPATSQISSDFGEVRRVD